MVLGPGCGCQRRALCRRQAPALRGCCATRRALSGGSAGNFFKQLSPAPSFALAAGKFTRRPVGDAKSAVPKRTERPIHGIKRSKDFVVANAVENILAAPPEPDVPPDFLHKEDFGRVPEYLDDVRREVEEEKEMARAQIEHAAMMREADEPLMRELGGEERSELLDALKTKWDVVNRRYQKMTHQKISTHTSSLGQIRAKENCERMMDELEKDIARLSVAGPIYVVDE